MPDVLDLNYEPTHTTAEPVGPLNVIVTFNDIALGEQARSDVLDNLQQLLFDDGFLSACRASNQSGWYSLHTAFVTVNAGFVSKHDLNHKLASTKRKMTKPNGVSTIEIAIIDKPHDNASLFPFSDDAVASSSPKTPLSRCICAA